jgi:LacI family transcriptional regulator
VGKLTKSVTRVDVARRAGTSPTAVSLVINNKYRRKVGPDVRDKILKAVEELNYTPHAMARSLASNKTHNVAVALYDVDYITFYYFSTIIGGIAHMVSIEDYNLQFATTTREAIPGRQNVHFMRKIDERRIDGLIVIDQIVPDKDLLMLTSRGVPCVLVDRALSTDGIGSVSIDNEMGAYSATKYLIECGHRKITFFRDYETFYKTRQMLKGYRRALEEAGIDYSEDFVLDESKCREGLEWSLNDIGITAIVTSADVICLKVMDILNSMGKKIPEDVSVIGYNDEPIASVVEPRLTTVKVPLRRLGEEAGELLFSMLRNGQSGNTTRILSPELVVRESCRSI